jgi:TAG lipase/steryl ester hydrolase/phospholipase A2/LPA acyltransferase
MLTGQQATWPKLSRIQNHVAIELTLDDTIQKLKGRLVFTSGPNDTDLKLPSYQGNDLTQRKRAKSTHKMTRSERRIEPPSPVLRKSAPTSPMISRATLSSPLPSPQTHVANHAKRRSTPVTRINTSVPNIASSSNDTSDRDYFADPDSDSTDKASSSSPPTSPTFPGLTLWPSTPQTRMRKSSQPLTPTAVDRRTGTLLNLAMTSTTSAVPSSPESRYKRLFHPPGPATPDVSVGEPLMESTGVNVSPYASRSGSRRGSGAGMPLDHSGTRGMLLRKKSYM